MPHLEQPMDLRATKSLPRRLFRITFIMAATTVFFLLGLGIVVITLTD